MVPPEAAGTKSDDLGRACADVSQRASVPKRESSGPLISDGAGRRVLDGAFAVLDALAPADGGLGLTALARATGTTSTSDHPRPAAIASATRWVLP